MSMHKSRRSWVKAATSPNSEINVTPLVDVVLVLLIIFMVLTPLMEKDITVRVPETEVEENTQPPDPDDTQIVVQVDESGDCSINTEKVEPADYVARLTRMLNVKRKDERVVFFIAHDKAGYGELVAALDGAKAAGAKVLAFATDVPQGAVAQGAPQGSASNPPQ